MKKCFRYFKSGVLLFVLCSLLAYSFGGQKAWAEGEQTDSAGGEQPVYHAAMGIQTANEIWIQRWGYFDGSQNEYYNTENYSKLYAAGGTFYDGTFEDVEIKGNGTYTVALKDADFAGETAISQMHIATDIPLAESEKLSFTDVTLEIDGNEVLKFDEAVMEEEEPYLQGGAVILLCNHWRDSVIQALTALGRSEDASNGWELLQGSGSENVSITFTVSGLPYDNEEQQAAKKETDEEKLEAAAEGGSADAGDGDTAADGQALSGGQSEESSLGATQVAMIVILVILAVLAILIVIVINVRKKGKNL